MSLPWLSQPVLLHSSRDPGKCKLTADQCAFKSQYWVFWYEADHVFGLPTVGLFLTVIGVFAIGYVLPAILPTSWKRRRGWLRVVSAIRFLSYKTLRLRNWNTPSLGVCFLGAVGFIFFLAMTLGPRPYYWPNTRTLSFGNSPPIATRTGYMALACMPFLFVLGTKASFVTALTGISHEKLNIWHNWVAWAMFVLALIHTFPFIIFHQWKGDMVAMWNADGMYVTGVIALLAQAWLTFMSIRQIRDRFYEFFKATHFFFAAVFFVFFFLHCDFRLTSWDYFIATSVLYCLSWLFSTFKTYFEHGFHHKAQLSLDSEENLRIIIQTGTTWKPGQHIFVRFIAFGVQSLTAHPFTISSLPCTENRQMVLYIKPRGGITKRLASLAQKQPNVPIPVLLDGPYGGLPMRWEEGFDHAVVVGGGAGAAFTLPLIESFIQHGINTSKDRRLTVVVASRDPKFQDWFLKALETIASNYSVQDAVPGLSVLIYQTSKSQIAHGSVENRTRSEDPEKNAAERSITAKISAASSDESHASPAVKLFRVEIASGRPDIFAIAEAPIQNCNASVGLVVCGPSSMVHDVAVIASTAQRGIMSGSIGATELWFHKESFTY